jgi:2-polyprenyl-6-methoxyphenol hydroxylase-like FAD-dependent oxidoreductase
MLKVLLSHIPDGVIKYGCNIVDIAVTDHAARLVSEDHQSQDFDLVVAADGIYSVSGVLIPPGR